MRPFGTLPGQGLLAEFTFAKPIDKAVALSLFLVIAARSAMLVAPLFDMAAAIVTGRPCCPVISAAANAEEAEKRLGALLREGAAIVALDNCSSDLEGEVLYQLAERAKVARLQDAKRRALAIADARAKENADLLAKLARVQQKLAALKRLGAGIKSPVRHRQLGLRAVKLNTFPRWNFGLYFFLPLFNHLQRRSV